MTRLAPCPRCGRRLARDQPWAALPGQRSGAPSAGTGTAQAGRHRPPGSCAGSGLGAGGLDRAAGAGGAGITLSSAQPADAELIPGAGPFAATPAAAPASWG